MSIPETLALFVLRGVCLLSCRKYLLRSLYSDLQNLSDSTDEQDDDGIPLGSLPQPTTSAASNDANHKISRPFHDTASRLIFAFTFSECCMMFLLLMLQGFEVLEPRTRLFNWKVSLFVLLAIILVIVPLAATLMIVVGVGGWSASTYRLRVVISVIALLSWLLALSIVPLPPLLAASGNVSILTSALARLIVLGTAILGLLSGYGSIRSIWMFLPPMKHGVANPSHEDISSAESSLQRVQRDLSQRKAESSTNQPSQSPWYSKLMAGDESEQEIKGLEALEYEMSRNVQSMRRKRQSAAFSETLQGRIYQLCGKAFAVYCYIRFVGATISVFLPISSSSSTNYPDLLSQLAVYVLTKLSGNVDAERIGSVARQISLLLVGVVIVISIRLVLRNVTRALRVTSHNIGASLMLLVLSFLMGIYLLATVVQLRTSFPPPRTSPGETKAEYNLYSTIPAFDVFGPLFNTAFLTAAVFVSVFRWAWDRVMIR